MMRPTWNRAISASARPRPRLKGGDPARNVEIARAVLAGEHGPPRDIVLVNAAAALMAAGKVATFLEGMAVAVVSIDDTIRRKSGMAYSGSSRSSKYSSRACCLACVTLIFLQDMRSIQALSVTAALLAVSPACFGQAGKAELFGTIQDPQALQKWFLSMLGGSPPPIKKWLGYLAGLLGPSAPVVNGLGTPDDPFTVQVLAFGGAAQSGLNLTLADQVTGNAHSLLLGINTLFVPAGANPQAKISAQAILASIPLSGTAPAEVAIIGRPKAIASA